MRMSKPRESYRERYTQPEPGLLTCDPRHFPLATLPVLLAGRCCCPQGSQNARFAFSGGGAEGTQQALCVYSVILVPVHSLPSRSTAHGAVTLVTLDDGWQQMSLCGTHRSTNWLLSG